MKEGVRKSEVFLLFLSKGVFTRPFCRLESASHPRPPSSYQSSFTHDPFSVGTVEEAYNWRKPIICIFEDDPRKEGKFDFGEAWQFENLPESFQPIAKHILNDVEAIPFQRREVRHFKSQRLDYTSLLILC